jgi:DNA (cytosine-5)-methyltransferase 1
MAGISVVASYDHWDAANITNRLNNPHDVHTQNIRSLTLSELPNDIDIVVGSPPCTQFSYANRGGNGNLLDGIQDIFTFLSIVDYIKPSYWAMENVPRVQGILVKELSEGGRLEQFRHLPMSIGVYSMQLYGVPQRRLRCIAGNFNEALLRSYAGTFPRLTLGDVVSALSENPVTDPLFAFKLDRDQLTDHSTDDVLSDEEARINHAAKTLHPVYNRMSFPDALDKPVRTITATCTRVSRESIVIVDRSQPGTFRRLSIRERATLQGFPITYQFNGASFRQKAKMVGNAVPPLFAFYLINAFLHEPVEQLPDLSKLNGTIKSTYVHTEAASEDSNRVSSYPATRRFRFAIPALLLGSGVRFELTNMGESGEICWQVRLVFGTPKHIHALRLKTELLEHFRRAASDSALQGLSQALAPANDSLRSVDVASLQPRWAHKAFTGSHPFELLDVLDRAAKDVEVFFRRHEALARQLVSDAIAIEYGQTAKGLRGVEKLLRNAETVAAGIYLGAAVNHHLARAATMGDRI